jgi:predicted ArsR family transcriptional regulator
MDFFDERVLAALKDGKPRSFTMLLGEVGFSHNTLQQHLDRLVARGLVVKEKMVSNSLGRPKFAYHVPSRATKQVAAALQNPYEALVTLQFSRLRNPLQVREGRLLQRSKEELRTSKLPPNPKITIITILHQLFNPPALV